MIRCDRSVVACLLSWSLIIAKVGLLSATEPLSAEHTAPNDPQLAAAVWLDQADLTESSGLAASLRRKGYFWTHNDSGGSPLVFAFDAQGRAAGQVRLSSIEEMVDWEDMASFVDDSVPRLLIADCGSNSGQRTSFTLYLFDEPDPTTSTVSPQLQTILVRYPDRGGDCEAVAVDVRRRQILLVGKSFLPAAPIYTVPLPKRVERSSQQQVTATRIGTLPLPLVTGMDLHSTSGEVWVVNYFQAFRFPCAHRDGSIARQLAETPEAFELPRWKQIEGVAIDQAGLIWVTSEGSPTPLGRLRQ